MSSREKRRQRRTGPDPRCETACPVTKKSGMPFSTASGCNRYSNGQCEWYADQCCARPKKTLEELSQQIDELTRTLDLVAANITNVEHVAMQTLQRMGRCTPAAAQAQAAVPEQAAQAAVPVNAEDREKQRLMMQQRAGLARELRSKLALGKGGRFGLKRASDRKLAPTQQEQLISGLNDLRQVVRPSGGGRRGIFG